MTLITSEVSETEFSAVEDEVFVPGVEVVLPTSETQRALLSPAALKLMGVLQRRNFDRCQTMMQRRGLGAAAPATSISPIDLFNPSVVCDLTANNTWKGRLDEASGVIDGRGIVRVRGWDRSENGVLIDGRPVMAPVFDVAIALTARVKDFRNGDAPFVLVVPEPTDGNAARLWTDLTRLAEDRLGVDRGTVQLTSRIR